MAQIYNSELIEAMIKGAALEISKDKIPDQLAEKVVPTLQVNPEKIGKIIVEDSESGSATSKTIYTFPTNKITYITGIHMSCTSSAASDCINVFVYVSTPTGAFSLISNRRQTTTASSEERSNYFNPPIKCTPGGIIGFTGVFAAGNTTSQIIISGYEEPYPR